MELGPDGSLYFVSYVNFTGGRIRRIGADGIVTGIAGVNNLSAGSTGDGGPALAAQLRLLAIGLAPDGSIYTVGGFTFDFDESRIRRISSPLPAFNGSDIAIPSDDGTQLFQFDAAGRHLRTINTLTNATVYTFSYDSAGRLLTVTDGDNNVTTIERNGNGGPTGILSPYGQRTSFTRSGNGYLASISNPANDTHQFTYNAGGQMLTERDPLGNLTQFTYDAIGRVIRVDDPAGASQTLTRTDTGSNVTVTRQTAQNRQTDFQVNFLANGDRERKITFPDGTQEKRTERGNGTVTSTDADASVTNETSTGDPRWKFQAPITSSTTVTTPGGVSFNSSFARTITLTAPSNLLSLVSQSDVLNINGKTYTDVYTAATRTLVKSSPLGRQTTTTVDGQGRLTSFIFANLNPLALTYDTRGRLSTFADGTGAQGRAFSFAYAPSGFLSSFTNSLNQTTSLSYDAAGRVILRTLPDNRNIGLTYDAEGNLASITPPGRPAHTLTYTPFGSPASYTAPNLGGSSTTSYSYDTDKQLTRITRPDSLEINYTYNSNGRLQTKSIPGGNYTYTFDPLSGNFTGVTAPGGVSSVFQYDGFLLTASISSGPVTGSVSYSYNSDLRVSSVRVNNANAVNYTYDNDNSLIGAGSMTLTRNAQNGLLSGTAMGGVTDTIDYDGFAEPTNYTARFNASTIYSTGLSYDKLGRIVQKVETIGGVTTTFAYSYDTGGRLTTVTRNGAITAYAYDSNDNRLSVSTGGNTTSGTYDAQDRLTQYGATTYSYTANGELRSKTTNSNATQYSYDVFGNLRNVTLPGGVQIEYVIDGENRRIGKKVNGVLTQGFLYQDNLQITAELDAASNVASRFVYASRSNAPDLMIKNGTTYRLIYDQNGSIRLVVNTVSGAIEQRIDYDDFGVVTSDTNPGFQPFGFAGGLYDQQTKLTRFGARDYDAETGRWTAKDPRLLAGGQLNLYAYTANDPITYIYPEGTDLKPKKF